MPAARAAATVAVERAFDLASLAALMLFVAPMLGSSRIARATEWTSAALICRRRHRGRASDARGDADTRRGRRRAAADGSHDRARAASVVAPSAPAAGRSGSAGSR